MDSKMENVQTKDSELGSTVSSHSESQQVEKGERLEVIRTISRVPGNANYHMKNGLRLEGDGEQHEGNFKVGQKIAKDVVGN